MATTSQSTPTRPNILFIMTDQQRGDCLGVEGHPAVLTPNLDAIAGRGVRFRHAYATCPSCIAARRSILSGQTPQTHGLVGYKDYLEWNPPTTMPQEFAKAGYETFFVGRSMHQWPRRKRLGFDHMVLVDDSTLATYPTGHGLHPNSWTAHPWHLDEKEHPTNRTAEEAVHYLQTTRDPTVPFFLMVSFAGPHPPLYPPAFYMDRYLQMDLPAPVIGDWAKPPEEGGYDIDADWVNLTGEALKRCQAGYFGLINHIDDQLTRILFALASDTNGERPLLNNTVIVFTSDHGEMLGDHYHFRKAFAYEGSARIPLLMRLPERYGVRPRQAIDQAVCHEDLMPTLLDIAGLAIPPCVEGKSLLPLMQGGPPLNRQWLHGEHTRTVGQSVEDYQANHYLTDGREKYIWFPQNGREHLFDLAADPHELHDLAIQANAAGRLALWRERMIEALKDRPEGFTDGKQLIAGRPYAPVIPARK